RRTEVEIMSSSSESLSSGSSESLSSGSSESLSSGSSYVSMSVDSSTHSIDTSMGEYSDSSSSAAIQANVGEQPTIAIPADDENEVQAAGPSDIEHPEIFSADEDSNLLSVFCIQGISMEVKCALLMLWMILSNVSKKAVKNMLRLISILSPRAALPTSYKAMEAVLLRSFILKPDFVVKVCLACLLINCSEHPVDSFEGLWLLNVNHQVELTVERHLNDILSYQRELRRGFQTDILNSAVSNELETGSSPDIFHLYFLLSADGANFFKVSEMSVWPFCALCLNLPVRLRQKFVNIITIALFTNRGKPNFEKFLPTILNRLPSCVKVRNVTFFLHFSFFTCDLPALSHLFGIKQFNGQFACPRCILPGKSLKVSEKGQVRVFPAVHGIPLRTNAMHAQHLTVLKAQGLKDYFGIKRETALLKIIRFPENFIVDSMHCLWEGQVKHILAFLTDSKTKSCNPNHYRVLGSASVNVIDSQIMQLKLPQGISNVPPISQLSLWKAKTYKIFALYLFPSILLPRIENPELRGLLLLLNSIYNLLYSQNSCVSTLKRLCNMFLNLCPEFFGERVMLLNFHLLYHLPDQYERFGPLYCASMFPFESAMHGFNMLHFGSRFHGKQISEKFFWLKVLLYSLQPAAGSNPSISDALLVIAKHYCNPPERENRTLGASGGKILTTTSADCTLKTCSSYVLDVSNSYFAINHFADSKIFGSFLTPQCRLIDLLFNAVPDFTNIGASASEQAIFLAFFTSDVPLRNMLIFTSQEPTRENYNCIRLTDVAARCIRVDVNFPNLPSGSFCLVPLLEECEHD
ncbi:hypothetical protein BOX15_Mlig007740g2, partial [Macrostomum lignano]